jgi:hypothetical protein
MHKLPFFLLFFSACAISSPDVSVRDTLSEGEEIVYTVDRLKQAERKLLKVWVPEQIRDREQMLVIQAKATDYEVEEFFSQFATNPEQLTR